MFVSRLLIGVPVRPKKKAFGSALRIFTPNSRSCVRCASSTITMMLSRSLNTVLTSPNLKMVVIIILRWSPRKNSSSFSLLVAEKRFGISARVKSPVIWSSRSTRSSTITTVGLCSSGMLRSFCAANTISHDLPLPWKCQISPRLVLPSRTRSTMALPPSYCW